MNFYHTVKMAVGQLEPGVYIVIKRRGETLAVLLERVRIEYRIASDVPLTYAGRLDPMAEGLMIILSGEKCKEKDTYLGYDKTYQFEILLGVSTDSADILGRIVSVDLERVFDQQSITQAVESIGGAIEMPYPIYSSKPVDGKPLFAYAREGITPSDIPLQKGIVRAIVCNGVRSVLLRELCEGIIHDIAIVEGDFRQKEITDDWDTISVKHGEQKVLLVSCVATVTSGIYIRTLAELIGKKFSVPACAYAINRIAIGTSVQ